jgi:phenylpropionate dioxygenase-like ring-hydroxylating dioxygenase large terminal subunit
MDLQHIRFYIDDRVQQDGVFRVHKDVFADPEVFEMEMRFIFGRTWNFLGLESQIAKPHDFLTTWIGRTPVMVSRDAQGRIGAFVNACRHKGATVCRVMEGNAKYHVCPYHGWAYDSAGRNVDIKDRKAGCYAPAFDAESHDLLPIAKIGAYNGLIFGSLSSAVPALEEWLGEMRPAIDLSMEQSPLGMEFVPGRVAYTYRANWKLQYDNGLDSYHLTSTHTSFMDIQARRRKGEGHQEAKQYDWATRAAVPHGMFSFPYGHSFTWTEQPEVAKRQLYPVIDEVKQRVGELKAAWMLRIRQTCLFPNMQINDGSAMILRVIRPIDVDLTEMRGYVLAPIGERADLRACRLRQFEDFFNPGGFATPDDTVTYEDAQRGFAAKGYTWVDGYARGATAIRQGGNDISASLGFQPLQSLVQPLETFNEVALHGPYREWARLMEAGLAGE